MVTPITVTNLPAVGRTKVRAPDDPEVYVTFRADFSQPSDVTLDFTILNQQNTFGIPRAVFIDNSNNPNEVVVLVAGTQMHFTAPAYSEGYYKIDANAGSAIEFITTGGATSTVTITIYNYDVAPNVWYRYGANNINNILLQQGPNASGVNIDAAPNNNPLFIAGRDTNGVLRPVAVDTTGALVISPIRGSYANKSGVIVAANVSQVLLAANANRKRFFIQNPLTAAQQGTAAAESLFINYIAAAGINDGMSVEIQAGGSLDFMPPVATDQVSIIAATVGHKFICKEM